MSGFLSTMLGVSSLVSLVTRNPKIFTATNGAALSTTQTKFGTASIFFDGTNDLITSPDNADWTLSTGPYTIEFFLYTSDTTAEIINASDHLTYKGWSVGIRSNQRILFVAGNGSSTSVLVPSNYNYTDNTWAHVAVCKDSGTNVAIFVNGSRVYANGGWNVNIADSNTGLRLGFGYGISGGTFSDSAGNTTWFNGYIDEIRISDVDRYGATNSTITAPTAAFTNDADTLLLIHADGTNGSTTITDDSNLTYDITYRSDTYASNVELAVPFSQWTNVIDVKPAIKGSGSSATVTQGLTSKVSQNTVKWTSSPNYGAALWNSREGSALTYALSTSIPTSASGTYVVEAWVNAGDSATNSNWCLSSADSGGRWLFGFNTGSSTQFAGENWVGIGTGWHHIAIVCDAGTKRFYLDGIYKAAFSTSNTGFSTLHVGQFNAGDANDFIGYMQDLRVTIGSVRGYTGTNTGSANFTLPSSIIQSVSTS